jgi:DNA-binding MarR family transcriptional regulator
MRGPEEISPPDPFDGLLGYHLRRASVAVMADLAAALAPLGLKPVEASVLFLIGATDGQTQAEIGRALGIQRANMAPLIAGLLKLGLLARQAVDGRSQALRLTARGKALHAKAIAAAQDHEQRLFAKIPGEDRRRMINYFRGLWNGQTPT